MGLGALPPRRLLAILAVLTTARLAAAAVIPLTDDEAYYRLWAARLQFGYFDHPPMIAWWIRAGETIAGPGALGVRLLPVLAVGATSLLVFDLARQVGAGERTAERAAIWFNAMLLIALGAGLAAPDAPNILFWTLCLVCVARAVRAPQGLGWWAAAGVAAGLATLSKYSALFLAPGLLLWLAGTSAGRRQLTRPGPWLAAVLAVGLFGVNVAWNAAHQWVTFVKQFGRAVPEGFAPQHLAELLAAQFVLANPVVAVFAARAAAGVWGRRARGLQLTPFLLVATSLPFAAYLVLHSLHAQVQGQWPAPLYPAVAVLAAVAAEDVGATMRRWADVLALGLAALVAGLGLAHAMLPGTDRFGPHDPVLMLRGWPAFAREAAQARDRAGAGWIGVLSYQTKAQLQLALGPGVPVVQLDDRARYGMGDSALAADFRRPGLVIDHLGRFDRARLAGCFTSVSPAGALRRGATAAPQTTYPMSLVSGPRRDLLGAGC